MSYRNAYVSSSSEDEEESSQDSRELPETDADESIIALPSRRPGRRVLYSSEEEDDEPLILSPRTRRSIGMPASAPFIATSGSESEDRNILTDESEGDDPQPEMESKEDAQEEEISQVEEDAQEEEEEVNTTTHDGFESSISEKLSSTRYSRPNAAPLHKVEEMLDKLNISRESDIVLIDSDDSSTPVTREKVLVTQAAYDHEQRQLEELLASQQKTADLYNKLANSLPDKGAQLLRKTESIDAQITDQIKRIEGLAVKPKEEPKSPDPEVEEGAVGGEIVPVKSERAQKRLENQEKVTMETINNIHKSLNACPPEDLLMEQPAGLKVQLMNHQRYALTFMTWRESNKPKGGILADDMGTGKTLTMISLILLDKERKNSDDDDDSSPSWKRKDARNMYKGGTLVVCPASLMQQWCNEVKTKCKAHVITGYQHHGPNREDRARRLAKYDIVVTTYSTLSSEANNLGPLFGLNWHRVVLDEGHVVRNHKTACSKACCDLEARNRWILTGTPIQNCIKDLYAPIKFLKCSPFDDVAYWNACIGDKKCRQNGEARVHTILKLLMLRRTKVQLQERGILDTLPDKTVKTVQVTRTADEDALYNKFLLYSQSLFAQYLVQRREMNAHDQKLMQKSQKVFKQIRANMGGREISTTDIFTLILRLRQICCHPGLIKMNQPDDQDTDVSNDADDSGRGVNLVDLLDRLDLNKSDSDVALGTSVNTRYNRDVFLLEKPSSKIFAIIGTVSEISESGEKMVIVSQWTSVLDILSMHLDMVNISYLTLTGKTKIADRGDIVRDFNDPSHHTRVLLLSLAAGGVGLNLIGGNNLLIVDPHWNPQLELQAQDRVYRIGQRKCVQIVKFITKDSMEERVMALQNEKLQLADTVLTGAKKITGNGLSVKDLRTLFDM